MSTTGLKTFDETVHLTNIWLNELQEELKLDTKQQAYHVLRVVLHHLRDLLPPDAAMHLAAQMPMLVRGFYVESWRPGASKAHPRTRADFLGAMEAELANTPKVNAEQAVTGVFRLLEDHVTAGEIQDVVRSMPEQLKEFWEHPKAA